MAPASPQVSVITTTYNHASYLGDCVRSVLAQTFPDWEQIIVDDGSTDATPGVAASFTDPRIRYFRRERVGVLRLAETYNFALSQARAPLIAILEGDDYWNPRMLERQTAHFRDPETVFAYAELAAVVDGAVRDTDNPTRRWPPAARSNFPVGSALAPILSFDGMPQPATWLVRRSALEKIGGFRQVPGIPTTDYPTILFLCLEGRFAYAPEILAYWRKHAAQTTNQYAGAVFSGCADFAARFYEREVSPEIKARLGVTAEELSVRIDRQRAFGRFRQGRYELLARRWPDARRSFRDALRGGSPYVRTASAAGWCASWLRSDLELCARLAGKEWYRRPNDR